MKLYKALYHRAITLESSINPTERRFSVLLHKVSHALHDMHTGESPDAAIMAALVLEHENAARPVREEGFGLETPK